MAGCEGCEERWRVEAADLRTGVTKAVLTPLAMDFEKVLNGFGTGTLTLATKDVQIRDIWPHATSIHIVRTTDPDNPVIEWVGYVEKVSASDNGTTSVGMQAIEDYINHRVMRNSFELADWDQRDLATLIVNLSEPYNLDIEFDPVLGGIPLIAQTGLDGPPKYRTLTFNSWDRKSLGASLVELTELPQGVSWETVYYRPGELTTQFPGWSTAMVMRNHVGESRDLVLRSDRETNGYGLDVDAANHATFVDGVGAGQEEAMLIAQAVDDSPLYPQFDAVPAWKDVDAPVLLQDLTDGYLEDNREPVALPSVTIPGHDVASSDLRLGDDFTVDVDFGAVTYKGRARVLAIAWSVSDGQPDTRTLTLYPTTRASESVLFQQATDNDCEDC